MSNIALVLALAFIAFGAFLIVDCILYTQAKWPERSEHWWSLFPGSGFVALIRYGRQNVH